MNVLIDEPGRRFVAEEQNERMPVRYVLFSLALTLLIAAPWRVLWHLLSPGVHPTEWDPIPSALILAVGVYFIIQGRGGPRIERLVIDRENGRVDWLRTSFAGLFAVNRHLRLDSLQTLTIERETGAVTPASSRATAKPRALGLNFTFRSRDGRATHLPVRIDSVSQVAELAELAMSVGSISGLGHYRVLLNDPHAYRIELNDGASPEAKRIEGFSALGSQAARREASRAAATQPSAFDPAGFKGSLNIQRWEPGREVLFTKGWSADILLSPLMLAIGLPLAAWFRLPSVHEGDLLARLVAMVMVTLVGGLLAFVGGACFVVGLPRSTRFDWSTQTLTLQRAFRRRAIPFGNIQSLEVRDRVYQHRNIRLYTAWYISALRVTLRTTAAGAPIDEVLIETVGSRDPTEATAMATPMAQALAAAIPTEVRYTPAPSE